MLQQKKLAFRVRGADEPGCGKPERRKSLFFSIAGATTLAASLIFSSCAHARPAEPAHAPAPAKANAQDFWDADCSSPLIALTGTLEEGEKVLDKKCAGNTEYVLTDRNLIALMSWAPVADEQKNVWHPSSVKADIQDILKHGLVRWEVSATTSYFLTEDRYLTVIPTTDTKTFRYKMPFETKGLKADRMAYISGYLVVASEGKLFVVSDDDHKGGAIQLPFKDGGFYQSGGSLFFGTKGGDSIELTPDGKEPKVDGR
jgi:hypothetical protein